MLVGLPSVKTWLLEEVLIVVHSAVLDLNTSWFVINLAVLVQIQLVFSI